MRTEYLFTFFFAICSTFNIQAQNDKNDRTIYGAVENKLTREPCYNGTVDLLRPDSSLIASCKAYKNSWDGKPVAGYHFENLASGEYILRYTFDNFQTLYRPITLQFSKREFVRSVGYARLDRKPKEIKLKGATVSATRIKIYTKNDTLIYNADAFQLSEGSMLDALIRQLPGAELRDNGQILVNGRVVESLLLNGEDFIQADRSIMLQNLPSYMVKDVKVYERAQGRLDRFMNSEDAPKEMVMDVHLKRQYSIGWIANAEGGLGTENRFMGRVFALRFTPHSRITLLGNVNNVNDTRTPGETDSWTPDLLEGGRRTDQIALMDYMVNDVKKKFYVNGWARFDNTLANNEFRRNRENFLSSGNTFERTQSHSREEWLRLFTTHEWNLFAGSNFLKLSPTLSYSLDRNNGTTTGGTFLEDPRYQNNSNLLDSLYNPQSGALIRRILLNRSHQRSNYKYEKLDANANLLYTHIFHVSDDRFEAGMTGYYSNQDEYRLRRYRLDYPLDGTKPVDFRNEYDKSRPERANAWNGVLRYRYHATNELTLTPSYTYTHRYKLERRSLYRIDQLDGWGEDTETEFGELPSTTDWKLQTLDERNSFESQTKQEVHDINLMAHWKKQNKKNKQEINVNLPLEFVRHTLDYRRDGDRWTPSRNATFFKPNIQYNYTSKDYRTFVKALYSLNASMPAMLRLVDFRDELNPLNITMGNPDLKNTHTHKAEINYQRRTPKKQRYFNAGLSASVIQEAIAMGYTYNHTTGVRTSRPENVNGNWNLNGQIGYNTPLDKNKRWTLSTQTSAEYSHNVDLYATEDQEKSGRSSIGWTFLSEELKADYSFRRLTIGAKVKATWGHADGSRTDFETINTGDMIYALRGQLQLPWNIKLGTDLNLYSRRGYNDRAMNTDDFVWNARISKSLMQGNLVIMADGFDILHNLSNVTRTLNAQGRTETYRNVLPRYVMFHAIYRLNLKPKKKPGE